MPPKKIYTCNSCNKTTPKWSGQCSSCGGWNTFIESEVATKKYSIPKVSVKRKAENEKAKEDNLGEALQAWFDYQRTEGMKNPICENCGTNILYQLESEEEWVWKSSHAHILPKKTFESVKTLTNNHLLLCKLCHGQFDSSWSNASKMKVWTIAVNRVKLFIHLVNESLTKTPFDGLK
jgi:hypothetical protein